MTRTDIRLPGAADGTSVTELARFELTVANTNQGPDAGAPIAQQPLHGCGTEHWLAAGPLQARSEGRFSVRSATHYQFISASVAVTDANMRSTSESLYRELLALVEHSPYPQLVRFWNYVPHINRGADDAEVYRQFCWGRADAFTIDKQALPAATAIGSQDGILRVSLLSAAPEVQVTHLENPRQVSAYDYPRQYGPRSPSFARATQISMDGEALLLLSGTSSIVAHETRHPHNLCQQTAETSLNISELLNTSDRAEELKPIHFRFYLRDPQALEAARSAYGRHFSNWPPAAYLQGDICRSALVMEIDGVFSTQS